MEIVTSRNNKYIKLCRSLQEKKYRREENKCLLESEKIIKEANKNNFKLLYIFTTDKDIELLQREYNCQIILVNDEILRYISTTVTPQNMVGIAECKNWSFELPKTNYIVLDSLQDPSNIGAILRTGAATNFCTIYTIDCVDIYNPKVIRSSMGNIFKCRIMEARYSEIKNLDDLYICDMNGENIFNIPKFNKVVGLCIGNEGHGISDEIIKNAKKVVSIPMENDVESLNASVSAGIIMYHIKVNQ